MALTAAALWFVAQTTLAWAQMYTRDPALAHQLEVEVVPALSTANVRELLKAVLPLRQLTPAEAMDLVITHLIHRARSTSSRLKSQAKPQDSSLCDIVKLILLVISCLSRMPDTAAPSGIRTGRTRRHTV